MTATGSSKSTSSNASQNSSNKQPQGFRWPRPAFLLGLFFILVVAWIWVASSMLAQYLFTDDPDSISSFLMTYIGVALFAMLLPLKQMMDRFQASQGPSGVNVEPCSPVPILTAASNDYDLVTTTPYRRFAEVGLPENCDDVDDRSIHDDDSDGGGGSTTKQRQKHRISHNTRLSSGHARPYSFSSSPVMGMEEETWTHVQHFRVAAQIAPIWFIANWAYNTALQKTSIASSTVLASMCSVFSLVFAIGAGDEKLSYWKVVGCVLGICGTLLTAAHDLATPPDDGDNRDFSVDQACSQVCQDALMGDLLALFAAVGFSINAVQFRILCPKNEDLYSMQLLLGYMGLINLVVLSPYAIYKLTAHIDMPFLVFLLVVIRGFFDYVVSEYLHFRAVVLTNATVASVGLGLTIPLAFAADLLLGATHVATPLSMLGALAVLASFIVVVIDTTSSDDHGHHGHQPQPSSPQRSSTSKDAYDEPQHPQYQAPLQGHQRGRPEIELV